MLLHLGYWYPYCFTNEVLWTLPENLNGTFLLEQKKYTYSKMNYQARWLEPKMAEGKSYKGKYIT